MKIAIIGSGFYGSYIAYKLSKTKGLDVEIFERKSHICSEVARLNQYRLHTGFHYPRSDETIKQTILGYNLFKKEFKSFIKYPENNLYLIQKRSSISFSKYKKIFKFYKLPYKEINLNKFKKILKIKNFQGGINTKEGVIKIDKLINFFKKKLSKKVKLNFKCNVVKIDNLRGKIFTSKKTFDGYDLIINTTYQNPNLGLRKKKFSLKYELSGMVKLSKPYQKFIGITVMDGKFCSLYPHENQFSTISSVKFTPIFKSLSYQKVLLKKKKLNKTKIINKIIEHAKEDIRLPKILKNKKLIVSYKVKIKKDINDIRTSNLIKENKQISVLCGKLDAALVIYSRIRKYIKI